ncbi:endoribonuclease YbeY isoform X1 [Petromyzon marinus]|uniref:Endoribonuclease YbeY isoform X1 n=1 Tax=Petromyzon marinus TaxID=7757 RepID=A0AAJ7SQ45_PETMA|nr:endoribonuclease YbeY isoform X1 [Petromyzon marinus]
MAVVSGGMSVLIRNAQALVPVSRSRLRRDAELLLRVLLVTGRSAPPPPPRRLLLSALCVSSRRIRNLNLHYRGEDRATDVLAFPYAQVVAPGVLPEAKDGADDSLMDSLGDVNLGDVYLGVSYIQQSLRAGERFHDALTVSETPARRTPQVTLLHGMCHLLGYTHDTMADWKQMYEKESEVLLEYGRNTGITLAPLTAGTF